MRLALKAKQKEAILLPQVFLEFVKNQFLLIFGFLDL